MLDKLGDYESKVLAFFCRPLITPTGSRSSSAGSPEVVLVNMLIFGTPMLSLHADSRDADLVLRRTNARLRKTTACASLRRRTNRSQKKDGSRTSDSGASTSVACWKEERTRRPAPGVACVGLEAGRQS